MNYLMHNLVSIETVTIDQILTNHHVPGCAIGSFDRETKLYRVFGSRTNQSPEEGKTTHRGKSTSPLLSEHTSFRVASLTKPVFAYLVLKLVSQGLLDLDTPLAAYYQDEQYQTDHRMEQITAKMILSHQTGFPNWSRNKNYS